MVERHREQHGHRKKRGGVDRRVAERERERAIGSGNGSGRAWQQTNRRREHIPRVGGVHYGSWCFWKRWEKGCEE